MTGYLPLPPPTPYEERFLPDKPKHVPKHGTYSEYTNHRCRCVHCRAANTRYNLKRRKNRREKLLSGEIKVEHGLYSTYTNYGCRCDACKEANAERVAASESISEPASEYTDELTADAINTEATE